MRRLIVIGLCVLLAACQQSAEVMPTSADPNAVATGFVLTENAPPSGFETVSFPELNANLERLTGWRYEMFFSFDGVFSGTSRQTSASAQASVTYNQVSSARRVIGQIDVDLQDTDAPIRYEGVRLGPDVFLVRDQVCSRNTDDARLLADLDAGSLLGGVQLAVTAAQREVVNGIAVWRYEFLAEDVITPNVILAGDARLLSVNGQLWVSPDYNVVVRYYLTLDVENATIFDQSLPISGLVTLQYDLFDVGTVPNITVPNGC